MSKFVPKIILTMLVVAAVNSHPLTRRELRAWEEGELGMIASSSNVTPTSADYFSRDTHLSGTMVFMGSGRCGRCKYWAPKFKAWVDENKKAKTDMSKMTFKFLDCNSGKNMRTCWNAGVRQYPGVGVYDKNGKQTSFYMNTSGMKKLWDDYDSSKETSANPSLKNSTQTRPIKVAPPKLPQHAFGQAVNLPKAGVDEVTKENFSAWVKKNTESVIFFGSVGAQYAQKYGSYWVNVVSQEKQRGSGKAKKMGFGVVDCDDFHSLCYDQGAWTLPLMVAYKDGKPEYSWTIFKFNQFLAEIKSTQSAPTRPPSNANRRNGMQELFKSAGASANVMKAINSDNWTKKITTLKGKSLHVFYGSAGCGRTQYWVPKMWKNTKALAPSNQNRVFAYVDCQDDMSLCWSAGVRQYPMVAVFEKGKEAEKFSANAGMTSYLTNYPAPKETSTAQKGRTPTKRNYNFSTTAGFKTPSGNSVVKSRKSDKLQKEMGKLHGVVKLTKSTWDSFAKDKKQLFVFYGSPNEKWTKFLGKFFSEAVEKYGSGYSGAFVDCDIESGLCADKGAKEMPTVVYYKDGQQEDGYIGRQGVFTWVHNIWIKTTGKAPDMRYRK